MRFFAYAFLKYAVFFLLGVCCAWLIVCVSCFHVAIAVACLVVVVVPDAIAVPVARGVPTDVVTAGVAAVNGASVGRKGNSNS